MSDRSLSVRSILARFAYSLLIVGIALTWPAKAARQSGRETRASLCYAGSVICIVAGFAGVRLRHRGDGRWDERPGKSAGN